MRITIEKNEQAFDLAAAERIVQQIKEKPESVIGLSTGRTTGNMHRLVAQIHRDQPFDASRATFFGIDEVTGVPRSYSGACYTMLKTEIIDDLGVDEDHFLMLPTESDDLDADCKHFSDELQHRGGIDLLILGLGENGHLGFNQPGTSFESTVGIGSMDSALENRIRRETGVPAEHSLGGVTLGLSDIMQARRIILVVKGASKAEIVKQVLRGPVSTDVPASILQRHPHCEVLLDADAASCLPLVEKKSEGDKPSYLAPFLTMVFLFLIIGFLTTVNSQLQGPLQSAFLARVGSLKNTMATMVFFFNSRDEFESITRIPSQPKSTLSKRLIKKYKSVIFDLDNTLLDTTILMPFVDKIQLSPSGTDGNKELWKEHDDAVPQCKMYEGMSDVLKFIQDKGIKTAIVTNSVKRRIEVCAKAFDLPVSEKCMIGRYSVTARVPILKPDKRLFEKAIEQMGATADSVISFGNTAEDIQTAHNAGVESVACHWGATEKEREEMQAANPTYSIETPSEIIPLLSKTR